MGASVGNPVGFGVGAREEGDTVGGEDGAAVGTVVGTALQVQEPASDQVPAGQSAHVSLLQFSFTNIQVENTQETGH